MGGGISGLSLGFFLSKQNKYEIIVLEKEKRVGGFLGTDQPSGFLFERGPRTFRKQSDALLQLVEEIGLQEELISSSPQANRRFLSLNNKLVPIPSLELLLSCLPALAKEWCIPPSCNEETVWDFAVRRFNTQVAQKVFDPMALGIFAGDSKELSMNAAFPSLKLQELQYGSLTKAWFSKTPSAKGLLSFKNGTETLIQRLEHILRQQIVLEEEVKTLQFSNQEVVVTTNKGAWRADYLFSTLPAFVNAALFAPLDKEISALFATVNYKSLTLVHLGYREMSHVPKQLLNGFGYLVPTLEQRNGLGVVFDSSLFAEHNSYPNEVRLTIMLKEGGIHEAKEEVKRYLGIKTTPNVALCTHVHNAIPQYTLGHERRIAELTRRLHLQFGAFCFLGNYVSGVSVNDCIALSSTLSKSWKG